MSERPSTDAEPKVDVRKASEEPIRRVDNDYRYRVKGSESSLSASLGLDTHMLVDHRSGIVNSRSCRLVVARRAQRALMGYTNLYNT